MTDRYYRRYVLPKAFSVSRWATRVVCGLDGSSAFAPLRCFEDHNSVLHSSCRAAICRPKERPSRLAVCLSVCPMNDLSLSTVVSQGSWSSWLCKNTNSLYECSTLKARPMSGSLSTCGFGNSVHVCLYIAHLSVYIGGIVSRNPANRHQAHKVLYHDIRLLLIGELPIEYLQVDQNSGAKLAVFMHSCSDEHAWLASHRWTAQSHERQYSYSCTTVWA